MIAKSDVIILVVSASALAAGIYRWQSNMDLLSISQNSVSSPTAAVLDAGQAANAAASTVQQNNASVAGNNTAGSTSANTTNNNAVNAAVNGNNTGNDLQNIAVGSDNNATETLAVGSANQSANQSGSNNQSTEPLYGRYRVQSGDYLGKIAASYGTTVETLRSINNIEGSLIEIDQEILYPLPAN